MVRLKPKRLRGSVQQNVYYRRGRAPSRGFFYKIKMYLIAITAGVALLGLLWLWLSGWPARQMQRLADASLHMTRRAHFIVKDIVVEGRRNTNTDDILRALGVTAGEPILTFDPEKAHEKIQALAWVSDAIVERRLPDTIYVHLTEREPMARWEHDKKTVVIDREGKELPGADPARFENLLLVVGDSAPAETENLLKALKEFPAIASLVKGAVRVGERRWNLHLKSGVLVRLPEHKMLEALKKLDGMKNDQKILDRNVTGIDLRIPDRVFLEPGATPFPPPPESARQ